MDGKLVGPPDAGLQSVGRLRGRRARPAPPLPRSRSGRRARATRGRGAGSATSAARARGAPIARGSSGSSTAGCRRRSATIRASAGGASSRCRRSSACWSCARRQDPAAERGRSVRALRERSSTGCRARSAAPPTTTRAPRASTISGATSCCACWKTRSVAADARDGVADELLARWPYRGLDHLVAQVPARARPAPAQEPHHVRARRQRRRPGDARQPRSRAASPAGAPRPVANPEAFGGLDVAPRCTRQRSGRSRRSRRTWTPPSTTRAGATTPRRVSIGRGGHFITNPESLSPHYGGWIAARAFRCWRDMVAHGELAETDAFPIVEFGAGNGRLARDILDAATRGADAASRTTRRGRRSRRASRTASTRRRRRCATGSSALLGQRRRRRRRGRAPTRGDAGARFSRRRAGAWCSPTRSPTRSASTRSCWRPTGTRASRWWCRAWRRRCRRPSATTLGERIAGADASVRRTFDLRANAGDFYLDGETWAAVMEALAAGPPERARRLLGALWFEEAYVPAAAIPELAAHLAANADAVRARRSPPRTPASWLYVNVHAGRFIRELGRVAARRLRRDDRLRRHHLGPGPGRPARRAPLPRLRRPAGLRAAPERSVRAPGTQDMTADVNFTDLARAGRRGRAAGGALRARARRGRRRPAGAAPGRHRRRRGASPSSWATPCSRCWCSGREPPTRSPARCISPLPLFRNKTSAGGDQPGRSGNGSDGTLRAVC